MLYDLCGVRNIVAAAVNGDIGDLLSGGYVESFQGILPQVIGHGGAIKNLQVPHSRHVECFESVVAAPELHELRIGAEIQSLKMVALYIKSLKRRVGGEI